MQLQYVFGNPTKKKKRGKKMARKKTKKKTRKKSVRKKKTITRRKKSAAKKTRKKSRKKVAAKRRTTKKRKTSKRVKSASSKKTRKRRRRRNPVTKTLYAKKVIGQDVKRRNGKETISRVYGSRQKIASTGAIATAAELKRMEKSLVDAQATLNEMLAFRKQVRGKDKKTLSAQIKKQRDAMKALKAKWTAEKKASSAEMKKFKAIEKQWKDLQKNTNNRTKVEVTETFSGPSKYGKKKTKSKSSGRKKSKKKKTSKRGKKKSSSKKTTHQAWGGKKTLTIKQKGKALKKKGQRRTSTSGKYRVTTTKYKNPRRRSNPVIGANFFQQFPQLGPIAGQMSALAAGGAFYGYSNQLMSRYLPGVHSAMQGIPVVGPTLPNLLLGIGLTMLSKQPIVARQKMVADVVSTLGQGLIGSAAVGIGVNVSQMVPMLSSGSSLSGINYTPGPHAQIPGAGKADFGAVKFTPEMAGVDFTAEMGAVDFTPGSPDAADFGEYQQSEADFGAVPYGMN